MSPAVQMLFVSSSGERMKSVEVILPKYLVIDPQSNGNEWLNFTSA